jgi:hypothetical protein
VYYLRVYQPHHLVEQVAQLPSNVGNDPAHILPSEKRALDLEHRNRQISSLTQLHASFAAAAVGHASKPEVRAHLLWNLKHRCTSAGALSRLEANTRHSSGVRQSEQSHDRSRGPGPGHERCIQDTRYRARHEVMKECREQKSEFKGDPRKQQIARSPGLAHRPAPLTDPRERHERPSNEVSNNRHRQRWTPADTRRRPIPGQACCGAGSPHRDLASGRRGHASAASVAAASSNTSD